MVKECIVCGEQSELHLKIIEYNIMMKWWMCVRCIQNRNNEWDEAKQRYQILNI